jgi:hypothetical protein
MLLPLLLLQGECVDVDNQKDCEGLRLRLTNKGAYTGWSMPSTPKWRCTVPSIRTLLGAEAAAAQQASAQQDSARQASKLVLEVGQREERAAGAQAAAAATAAAANAARLVSGRGPMMLKQIYFADDNAQTESRVGG